jgi:pimeloyl-ACP methyl ester carboxylesterase
VTMTQSSSRALAARALLALGSVVLAGCPAFHRGPMPGEPTTATFAELNGVRMRYVDVGSGPAVVLIHGFASSLETWDAIIPTLSKTHRVLALDLKGFGWTDRPEGDYSPKAQAALVLALMAERGIDKAALVGHSWGCSVALQMALAAPERVTRLALYDAFVYADQVNTTFRWVRMNGFGELVFGLFYKERVDEKLSLAFYDPTIVPESLVEATGRALDRPGTVAAALAAVRGQRYEEWEHEYRKVFQPTLLLWGREDIVTPIHIGERLSKELPRARLVVYPKCGHFPMLEAMWSSNAELFDFLAAELKGAVATPTMPDEKAAPETTDDELPAGESGSGS